MMEEQTVPASEPTPKSLGHEDLDTSENNVFQTRTNIDCCIIFLVEVKILKALFPQVKAGDCIINMSLSFICQINISPVWR